MNWLQRASAVCAALALAACARADLVPSETGAFARDMAPQRASRVVLAPASAPLVDELLNDASPWTGRPLAGLAASFTQRQAASTDNVVSLPSGPSSATLFLFALGGLGAWNLGRSARKIHLGALPEWYHSGGPAQIGHATPLDPDFNLSALPLCPFDARAVVDAQSCPRWRLWRDPRDRWRSHSFFLTAESRGPPRHS